MKLLAVNDIHSGYNDLEILKGVSMHLSRGEIIAIIGPNGAGKSTLMKTIFGLITPKEGDVLFMGESILGYSPERIVRLGIGYVPQANNVFSTLTVLENLEMGAFIEEDKSLVRDALKGVYELFPTLKEKKGQRAGILSGGERQMLAIGKALMLHPKVLLLDEPSAGLAPNLVSSIFMKIKEIRENGTALAIVEQNARRALEISDRGYVLDMGTNRFDGRGSEILKNRDVERLYLGGRAP
ncbi:MAG: ABC transporter ATP-binding protein [Candidatus Hydrothermarchaeota archaeon]|jgi:ABC-type branched-subunit amino acid transport system ATPase component|nr:ABC transporter ATP-binding protein [Candidatus Hydrothermarchaeota archaeon]